MPSVRALPLVLYRRSSRRVFFLACLHSSINQTFVLRTRRVVVFTGAYLSISLVVVDWKKFNRSSGSNAAQVLMSAQRYDTSSSERNALASKRRYDRLATVS